MRLFLALFLFSFFGTNALAEKEFNEAVRCDTVISSIYGKPVCLDLDPTSAYQSAVKYLKLNGIEVDKGYRKFCALEPNNSAESTSKSSGYHFHFSNYQSNCHINIWVDCLSREVNQIILHDNCSKSNRK